MQLNVWGLDAVVYKPSWGAFCTINQKLTPLLLAVLLRFNFDPQKLFYSILLYIVQNVLVVTRSSSQVGEVEQLL